MNSKQVRKTIRMPSKKAIRIYWATKLPNKNFAYEMATEEFCFACSFSHVGGLERAHITPFSKCGTNELENLHLLCWVCHKDSEMLEGDDYWKWFYERTIVDRMLSEAMRHGFNFLKFMTDAA